MRSPRLVLSVTLVGGCFADEGPMTAGQGTSGATTETETSDASATSSTTGAGSASAGTSDTTTTTTTATATTSASTGSTTSTTGTTGAGTTGAQPDCWGLDPSSWELAQITDARLGENPSDFRMSADGLAAVYVAGSPKVPYATTRASLDDPFIVGAPLPDWNGDGAGAPNLGAAGNELILGYDPLGDEQESDIAVSTLKGGAWTSPAVLENLSTELVDRAPTVTENGARVIFERNSGPMNPFLMTPTMDFYEAQRPAESPPGEPFVDLALVHLPGITDDAYAHLSFCPVLSSDGLRLFFGSTAPIVLDGQTASDALAIHVTSRAELDAPWGSSTRLEALNEETWQTCPMSITRDGCQMVIQRFKFPADPMESDPVRLFLLRRAP